MSEGQRYSCLEAKKQKKVLTGDPEVVYDTKDFWKELDHYRLFNTIWHISETKQGFLKG